MRIQRSSVLLATFVAVASQAADTHVPTQCSGWPSKPAWEWTLDERLEHRTDAVCLKARRDLAGRVGRRDGSCEAKGEIQHFVFGTDTPELFLPSELFDHLLFTAVAGKPEDIRHYQKIYESRSQSINVPLDFWSTVEKLSKDYLAVQQRNRELSQSLDRLNRVERRQVLTTMEELQDAQCRERARALQNIRSAFPTELFDRFLYVAVAPGLCSSGRTADNEALRWVQAGCIGARPSIP